MTTEQPAAVHLVAATALKMIRERLQRPLGDTLRLAAEFESEAPFGVSDLLGYMELAPADDATRLLFHRTLVMWDALDNPTWADGTRPQTPERRRVIYTRLELDDVHAEVLTRLFPPYIELDPGFSITGRYAAWFDQERQEELGFYWPRYVELLQTTEHWEAPSIETLSRATKQVVERLGDPRAAAGRAHAARGLVVGFVQSGKTANFTGVIARAVDAGYRLIVVLTGMTRILREQTQRRLDKQLIGKELLTGVGAGESEYAGVPDWDRFISYGASPSELGVVDWRRLTSSRSDYSALRGGIGALHFERARPELPLNAAENLASTPVRLVVVQKNAMRLRHFQADLARVKDARFDLAHLPALIIDDESDQASLNTRPPTQLQIRQRTAVNSLIVEILALLPMGQYVGYTATPFANVFADPNDYAGIFPRDFIIGLDRPHGYMGATDYHDFRPAPPGRMSNETAYVRDVKGGNLEPRNFQQALDSFLLTGAIKLYREAGGDRINTTHHTMLVHTSHLNAQQEIDREELTDLLDDGGYATGSAVPRLETLLREDFGSVSRSFAPTAAFPSSLTQLLPHLETCYTRVMQGPRPVLIVNGEERYREETPAFDEEPVWKVLVGGTKLSRGYTVEGLTVSYYRRTASAADTLMQMGRWFGFRQGYRDLMRLFIGREETFRRGRTLDLYKAFEGVCQDEMDFRTELRQYALPEDGSLPLRPMDVPPLVTQRHPDIRPAARNRMFNAIQLSANYGGKSINPTLAPTEPEVVNRNQRLARELVGEAGARLMRLGDGLPWFDALVFEVRPATMNTFVSAYRFSKANLLQMQLAFLQGHLGDPGIDRWVVIWPLLKGSQNGSWQLREDADISIILRNRADSGRFNVYTGSDHVEVAQVVNGVQGATNPSPDTSTLLGVKTGAALFYAVLETGGGGVPTHVTIGFALYPPRNALREKTKWGVQVLQRPDDPIVDADAT